LLAGLKERDQRQGVDDDADCSCISQMAFLTTRWSESSTRRLLLPQIAKQVVMAVAIDLAGLLYHAG
jgi:hypothetical protein